MDPAIIAELRGYCNDFRKFRESTEEGDGNNLHDIKNSFDYVIKTIEEYKIDSTNFGINMVDRAREASNMLSYFWNTLSDTEKAISYFCTEQENFADDSRFVG